MSSLSPSFARHALVACLLAAGASVGLAAEFVLSKGNAPELIETWGMDKGLPQTTVTAVIQTRDNYLWIGTDGGLARFDGMKFTTYRATNTPGLANHAVTELFEDRAGHLWIGTESGVARYRERIFETLGLEGQVVRALAQDAAGGLWVGTETGLHRYQDNRFTRVTDEAIPAGAGVQAIHADAAGGVWIGLTHRAGLVRHVGGKFERIEMSAAGRGEVLALAETPRGTIWLGTTDGLVRWRDGRFDRYTAADGISGRQVSELHADGDGGLWLASTAIQRIGEGDIKSITTVRSMVARAFHAIWRDREGNLWVGTPGDGLMCVRPAPFQVLALNARTVANGFRTVMQDGSGSVWLAQGTLGHLRIASDLSAVRTPPEADPRVGEVLAVYHSRAGDLWIGGRDALKSVRDGQGEVRAEFAGMRAMFEDSRGRMWMGRQNAGMIRGANGNFEVMELPAKVADCTPSSFAETATGDIWVGTWQHGVLRIHGREVKIFDRETAGLPTNEMRCVYVDREDRLWVGTRGRGLALLDGTQWLLPEWTSELIDQQISSLIEDDSGRLWLASSRGIFKIPREDLARAMRGTLPLNRLAVINATEGLRQELSELACFPAACRTRDGDLWFATRRGMVRIDAQGTTPPPAPPTVHIERVLVNGGRHVPPSELVLPPDTQGLAIEYTGLSFSAPGQVRFQYRMDGFDDQWIPADDRRMAHYPRLGPGRYRFRVMAANATGTWSEHEAAFAIVQRGYFYEQPWVWWLAGLTVLGGGIGAYRWRMAAHERERRRLEAGIAARTRELQIAKEQAEASTRARSEFLESMSHEIRNPLNGIIGLVAMLREAPLDAQERELAQSLGACAKGLARVFDEVLNFARLEHGHVTVRERPFALTALVDEVAALFRMMARQRGSEIVVRREGDVPERWVGDAEKIRSILSNFVSNALKYAPGSPVEILVQCDAADEFGADVTFNVTDRGPGIPAAEQERIFEKFVRGSTARTQRAPGAGLGLATCRAMAELMGGHVAVESPPTGQDENELAPNGHASGPGRRAAPTHGATFFLRVRLKQDRHPAPANAPALEAAPVATGRALIVEDQPYNQIVVRRIAERLGFASDVAANAQDALSRLARQTYAVVFVDWELPDLHGDELTRRMRAMPTNRDTIAIATTAHDSDEIRRACAAADMDGFALKPFETETIARLLHEARARRRGAVNDGNAPLDTRVFRFVGYDDPEQAGQAARLYLDILEQEVAMLEGAMTEGDSARAAAAAHRIKSHAGLVDAADLRESADRLQREAGAVPAVALAGLQQDLVRHAGVLRERLKSWRDEEGD